VPRPLQLLRPPDDANELQAKLKLKTEDKAETGAQNEAGHVPFEGANFQSRSI